MRTQSTSGGTLLQQNIEVVANETYNVQIDVMTTNSLPSDTEYADVSIDGSNVGRCNPNGRGRWDLCIWWRCPVIPSQVSSTTTSLSIQLQYNSGASGTHCTYNGQSAYQMARVTLTTGTGKLVFVFCCNCYFLFI